MAENNVKFEVGDNVKVLSYTLGDMTCEFINEIGYIQEMYKKTDGTCNVNVFFDKCDSRGWKDWWFQEKDLELAEDTVGAKVNDTPSSPHDDPVNHPSHYNQSSIECIDAIEAAINGLDGFEGHCTGTSMKYIWRWKWKNGTEDIKKAIWFLQKLLKYEEAKENK